MAPPRQSAVIVPYWLGEAYVRKGQTDLARECFQQTTKLDDQHFDTYLAWGKLLSARGEAQDHAVAADFFRQAIRLNARSGEAHLHLARACLGDYRREKTFKAAQAGETPDEAGLDEAIAHYEEAGKLDPGLLGRIAREVPEILRLKAQVFATRRQWDQAVAAVTKAIGREPGEPRNYLLRAAYQANAGQLDEASRDYEEAFQQGFTPPQTGTWLPIADALLIRKVRADLDGGQLAAARTKTRELEQAARGMLASAAKLHVDLARRHLEGGDLKLTIQESNAALACDETSADAYWIRGLAISRRGKPVLWEDRPGEPGEEQEHWRFPGWVKKTDAPADWMPNSSALARDIAWGNAWEKKWMEAWRKAWHADLSRAAELSPRYETELGKLGIATGRE